MMKRLLLILALLPCLALGQYVTPYNPANVQIKGGNIDGATLGATTPAPATVSTFSASALSIFSSEGGLVAHAGGGSPSALLLSPTANFHGVGTVATGGDSVKLPAATVGAWHVISNYGAMFMNVFPTGTDQINASSSVQQMSLMTTYYVCNAAGLWTASPSQTTGSNGFVRASSPTIATATMTGATTMASIAASGNIATSAGLAAVGGAVATTTAVSALSTTTTGVAQFGFRSAVTNDATATSHLNGFTAADSGAAGSYTTGYYAGLEVVNYAKGASQVVTSVYGITIDDQTSAGTNTYGIESEISSGTGKWNLYMKGTALNAMNTGLRVGSLVAPVTTVDVTGTLGVSGAVTFPGLASSSAATTGTMCWTTGTGNVNIDTTVACLASTIKVKQAIEPLDIGLAEVLKMRPVSYELKPEFNPEHLGRQVGLIAEDVAKIEPRLVALDDKGEPRGVRYMQMTAVLVQAVQDLESRILWLCAICVVFFVALVILSMEVLMLNRRPRPLQPV